MEAELIRIFNEYKEYAILISIIFNIIIALSGVLPSFMLTGVNMVFFGFWYGIFISFLGEAIGVIIAFVLYRKGLKKVTRKALNKYPKLNNLIDSEGKEAFISILSLRIMPFIPSGLITFAASVGEISLLLFAIASFIGKIPALLIEGISVYQIISFTWEVKLVLFIIGLTAFFINIRRKPQKSNSTD